MANRSLEWTSATWSRYAHQVIIAARGQLSSALQLQRYTSLDREVIREGRC